MNWPANKPRRCKTSWRLFPPQTREVQVDEKWAFVGKTQRHCDPENPRDAERGDHWDHVAEGIAVDYAADGRLAGIEILDARRRFGNSEVFRQVVLEDIALSPYR